MLDKITAQEFSQRRATLMQQLDDNSAVVIQSAAMQKRNSDVDYLFRQDSTFFYFTGFNEPDALLLLKKVAGVVEYHLFCQPRDKEMEIWFGYRCGAAGVLENYQADFAYSSETIAEKMPQLLNGTAALYYSFGRENLTQQVQLWLTSMHKRSRQGVTAPVQLMQLDEISNEMRLIKSAAEQQMMRRASSISAQAQVKAMRETKVGVMEYQLDAHIQHHFAINGCAQAAYPSIVGGGNNACILHYIDNSQPLQDKQLVLIDSGAEYQYYAGDITRTFPVNGKYSPEQRALYEVVLKANLSCIEMIAPGTPWDKIHQRAVLIITTGLVELGLLQGDVDELIAAEAYREYFMHKLGHWLGMDVHDVGNYKVDGQWRELAAGMVMTVEPGIYVSPDNNQVEERWRGIGIRIEDDVLVTENGSEVMSREVPKEIAAIEALMAS
ncbi:MAG: Xaa-Pro aminopeptidase [Pseudomonadales bacterium]|nr:Xaa-Pro aminopeptidase [Pseudomonadales bacterium]NRA18630.1 Xaa-Pro aminopeptidase [Oceanospirillaceae bacterium]